MTSSRLCRILCLSKRNFASNFQPSTAERIHPTTSVTGPTLITPQSPKIDKSGDRIWMAILALGLSIPFMVNSYTRAYALEWERNRRAQRYDGDPTKALTSLPGPV